MTPILHTASPVIFELLPYWPTSALSVSAYPRPHESCFIQRLPSQIYGTADHSTVLTAQASWVVDGGDYQLVCEYFAFQCREMTLGTVFGDSRNFSLQFNVTGSGASY